MASQTRVDQIRDLRTQWEQLVGYSIAVPDWAVSEMADNLSVASLFDFGQYMRQHQHLVAANDPHAYFVPESYTLSMPWAQFGMSRTEYDSKLGAFDSTFRTLTGQTAPQDLIDRALHEHQGSMTGAQFNTWLLSQDAIKQQYGWLKFGLDFNQFQTQKLQMRTSFGRELTDAEAVTQLQYLHTSGGGNVSAAAQQTLSQVEKKQAQTGVSGSVVR